MNNVYAYLVNIRLTLYESSFIGFMIQTIVWYSCRISSS